MRAALDAEADTGGPPNPHTHSGSSASTALQQGLDAATSAARREGLWELGLLTHHSHAHVAAAAAELRKSLTEGEGQDIAFAVGCAEVFVYGCLCYALIGPELPDNPQADQTALQVEVSTLVQVSILSLENAMAMTGHWRI